MAASNLRLLASIAGRSHLYTLGKWTSGDLRRLVLIHCKYYNPQVEDNAKDCSSVPIDVGNILVRKNAKMNKGPSAKDRGK